MSSASIVNTSKNSRIENNGKVPKDISYIQFLIPFVVSSCLLHFSPGKHKFCAHFGRMTFKLGPDNSFHSIIQLIKTDYAFSHGLVSESPPAS